MIPGVLSRGGDPNWILKNEYKMYELAKQKEEYLHRWGVGRGMGRRSGERQEACDGFRNGVGPRGWITSWNGEM